MQRFALTTIAVFALSLSPTWAHGPTPQKAEEAATIAASPEVVWKIAGDFAGIGAWHPLVQSVETAGANTPGSERTLILAKGKISDGLDDYDATKHIYGYRLAKENVEAFPVSFYTATFAVEDAGGGTSRVIWNARFYRGDTGNFPSDELGDDAAIAAMTEFFRRGLEGLKAKVEGKVEGK
jgi:mxaD protein